MRFPASADDATFGTVTADNIIAKGPWVDARAYSTLAEADAAASATGKPLMICTEWTTVPSTFNAAVNIIPGGKLNRSTATHFSNAFSGSYGCFAGTGTVTGLEEYRSEYFGLVGDGVADDTTAFATMVTALGTKTQGEFTKFPASPLVTVKFKCGSYKLSDTIVLKSLVCYDFNHSRIIFLPNSAKNLFEMEPAWSLSTYPTGFGSIIKNIYIKGDYNKLTGSGNARTCFYFPRTAWVSIENFAISKFTTGLQFGLDIGQDFSTHVGNYYNRATNGQINACARYLISNSAAACYSGLQLMTGEGAYAAPADTMVYIGSSADFVNLDVEMKSDSGFSSIFDVNFGRLTVRGTYQEGGAQVMAKVNTKNYRDKPGYLDIKFATQSAQGIVWYNDNPVTNPIAVGRYIQGNLTGGESNCNYAQYNHVTGDGLTSSGSGFSAGAIPYQYKGKVYPKYIETGTPGTSQLLLRIDSPPNDPFAYLHVITIGDIEPSYLCDTGTYFNKDHWTIKNSFTDSGIKHRVVKTPEGIYSPGYLRLRSLNGVITLLNVYFSDSPDTLTIENKYANYGSANPVFGNWNVGDSILEKNPVAGGFRGRICVTSGTAGSLSGVTGSITAGTAILTVNDTTNLMVGQLINIAGVTGIKTIKSISGYSVTLNSNASNTVDSAVVAYVPPVFKSYGAISE